MENSEKSSLDKDSPEVNRRLTMKYTKEERLDIGRRIYDGEISRYEAAEQYGINDHLSFSSSGTNSMISSAFTLSAVQIFPTISVVMFSPRLSLVI